MSLIQTQLSIVHLDSGINLSSALQKETRSAAFSFDGVTVTTTAVPLAYGSITSPRTITLKLVSGDDLLVSLDGGAVYPLSLHGNDDAIMVSLESRGVGTITCGTDVSRSLSGAYFDLSDAAGPVRVWMKGELKTSEAMVAFKTSAVVAAETITIDTKTYTFKATPTVEGDVAIGGSYYSNALNLIRAINHTGTAGTHYVCAAAHPQVSAAPLPTTSGGGSYSSFKITSLVPTSATIGLSTNAPTKLFFGNQGTATLTRVNNPIDGETFNMGRGYTFKNTTASAGDIKIGADMAATTQNLIKAINLTGLGNGTDYHAGTLINLNASCAESFVGNNLLVTAKEGGTLDILTAVGNSSFAAITSSSGTLSGGVDGITSLYGGHGATPPATPDLGRLIEVPIVTDSSANVVAAAVKTSVNADLEFSATVVTNAVTIKTAAPGEPIMVSAGTLPTSGGASWTFSTSATTPVNIWLKSLGTSEVVVAVIPN